LEEEEFLERQEEGEIEQGEIVNEEQIEKDPEEFRNNLEQDVKLLETKLSLMNMYD